MVEHPPLTRIAADAEPTAMPAASGAPVVVGVDGSELDKSLIRMAAREAALHHRPLRIVHTFNWTPDPTEPIPTEVLRDPAAEVLDRAVAIGRRADPVVEVTATLLEGPPVTVLLRESGAAALLVIGDGGLGRCTCVPVDATALMIAARAGCSVLVARDTVPPPGPIVVGVDGSPSSGLALDYAFDAARRRGRDLVVIRAWDPAEQPALSDAQAVGQLDAEIEPWRHRYPGVAAEPRVRVGDPADMVVAVAADAELVVASARGDRPWRGMLGGVSQALLYHCTTPVLIVREPHELYVQV
ncbi:universal stress protein [Plantactinospora sp. GCM10030261]|uniref:universal stress protein n=1 Tax=Plantactinospora sp. GCM10030261 TaxID=3273420 RepID=UPI0036221053